MRELTSSQALGKKRGPPTQLRPREGTKIGDLYDLLMANKGLPIEAALCTGHEHGARIAYLRDAYGLDIRCLSYRRWVLAGEWFGRTYVDYIADRLAQHDHAQPQPGASQ